MKATEDPSVKAKARRWGAGLVAAALCACSPLTVSGAEIERRAVLPATATHSGQPVGNFTALLNNGDGSFSVVTGGDSGQGENASKIHIRVYTIRPDFQTDKGGSGQIDIRSFFELRDPDEKIKFAIVESLTKKRILTAADLDIESMQRAPDGTFWFGDGFGPFLIHTDNEGKVLEAPIELADKPSGKIRTGQNPSLEEAAAVRIMNAFRADARANGNEKTLVFSPDFNLLDDCNPRTRLADRTNPPEDSGLLCASSEIFNVYSLQRAGFEVIPYTVNDKEQMLELMRLKVNGIISDRPDLLRQAVEEFDADGDGKPGDLLNPEGLIDPGKFSAQAHRGGRNLRPENTLPAMELALDLLVNTLETDCGITKDGVAVLSHDPFLAPDKWRKADGKGYDKEHQVLIKDHTFAELQNLFVGNLPLGDRPLQRTDPDLSPVSKAFVKKDGKNNGPNIYSLPSLERLFRFVEFYAEHYRIGEGKDDPHAASRWQNAAKVRFNVETKVNPRTDSDSNTFSGTTVAFRDRTIAPEQAAKTVADTILEKKMAGRADVQSFDFQTLHYLHKNYPKIRTIFLFGDFPKYLDPNNPDSDDGTNLQDQARANTPWMAGLAWPYRITKHTQPARARAGFNGLAFTSDVKRMLVMLGKPLFDGEAETLLICEFDPGTKKFTGTRYHYLMDKGNSYAGDLVMIDGNRGFVVEADLSRDRNGAKSIYEITLRGPENRVEKKLVVDLLAVEGLDPKQSSSFSFAEIGSLIQLDPDRLAIVSKSHRNYSADSQNSVQPEDTKFISVHIPPATKSSK